MPNARQLRGEGWILAHRDADRLDCPDLRPAGCRPDDLYHRKLRIAARSKASAAVVAQDKIHAFSGLYNRNPDDADLTPGDHGPEYVQVVAPATNTDLNRFRISWSVAPVPDPRAGKAIRAILGDGNGYSC